MERGKSTLLALVALLSFGCGKNDSSGGHGAGDASTTDSGSVGAGCANPSRAHSEGSEETPVEIKFGALPFLAGIDDQEGPSFYRLSGLQPGARYVVSLDDVAFYGDVSVFQTGFGGQPTCSANPNDGPPRCKVVPQATSLYIRAHAVDSQGPDGECFVIDAKLDSPVGAFEGATDALKVLRFGTPDLPHRGIVDHDTSYYRISQLEAGKRYTVVLTAPERHLSLTAGEEAPLEGVTNGPCAFDVAPATKGATCIVQATQDSFGVKISAASATKSSRFVLTVFEDVDSEGSQQAPISLAYAGGVEHAGRVGARPSPSTPGMSYYEVTGLTTGATHVASITNAHLLTLSAYTDAGMAVPVSCAQGTPFLRDCQFSAPGSKVFLSVANPGSARRFTLRVGPGVVNEGTFSTPKLLNHPVSFPYSGQTAGTSEYIVGGPLSSVLHQVTVLASHGNVFLDVSPAGASTASCVSQAYRCVVAPDGSGQLRVRATGLGAFDLDVRPAPMLSSTFAHDAGATPIPNGSSAGVTDTLTVSGSSVASIRKVKAELFITHGHPADLTAFLVAPDGVTKVQLVGKSGGPYEGILYDDYALEWYSGLWRDRILSELPVTPLYVFEGMNANGTWTLQVIDDETPNISDNDGELLGWGLTFE